MIYAVIVAKILFYIIVFLLIIIALIVIDVYIPFIPYSVYTTLYFAGCRLCYKRIASQPNWNDSHMIYLKFQSLNSKVLIRGIRDLPVGQKLFFYQEHMAGHWFDGGALHAFNRFYNQSSQIIASQVTNLKEALKVVSHRPDTDLPQNTTLIPGGEKMIQDSLNANKALFIMASGASFNLTCKRDHTKLYDYRIDKYTHKFKPGLLLLSRDAALVPVRITIDFPKWVQWTGRLHWTLYAALHLFLMKFIYSNRTLRITYGQPLDQNKVNADRKDVQMIMLNIRKLKVKLKNAQSQANHCDIKSIQAEVDVLQEKMQSILDKYEDYMYDLDNVEGDFENWDDLIREKDNLHVMQNLQ